MCTITGEGEGGGQGEDHPYLSHKKGNSPRPLSSTPVHLSLPQDTPPPPCESHTARGNTHGILFPERTGHSQEGEKEENTAADSAFGDAPLLALPRTSPRPSSPGASMSRAGRVLQERTLLTGRGGSTNAQHQSSQLGECLAPPPRGGHLTNCSYSPLHMHARTHARTCAGTLDRGRHAHMHSKAQVRPHKGWWTHGNASMPWMCVFTQRSRLCEAEGVRVQFS